jgi:hypothetical protein
MADLDPAHAGPHLGADLQQLEADGATGRAGKPGRAQADAAKSLKQDVGEGGEPEAELIGAHGGGRSAIGEQVELLEPGGEALPVRAIFLSPGRTDLPAGDPLQALLQERAVVERQQVGHMHPAVGVDADQVVVEGGVVDLGQGKAVDEHRLAELFVGVGHDMGSVQQVVMGQATDGAPVLVGVEHALAEGGLVQPLLDQAQGVASLGDVRAVAVAMAPASSPKAMRALSSLGSQSTTKVGTIAW